MKNLIKDTRGDAYVLIIVFLTIFAAGMCFMIFSDITDALISGAATAFVHISGAEMTSEMQETGSLLHTIFKFCLILVLILAAYLVMNKSQKPVQPW